MQRKTLLFILAFLTGGALLIAGGVAYQTKATIHEIFKLNELRKSQGYYLSEFEWTMLAAAHYLDTGQYLRSLSLLEQTRASFANPEMLTRLPQNASPDEQLQFYTSLQSPTTGAFLRDDSLPLFTRIGPTANMLALLEDLCAKTGRPVSLNHRLTFLDEIAAPDALVAFLEETTRVGWVGARFKPPFVCTAELWELTVVCERLGLYTFTPEWKKAYLDWFYAAQDPATGLWGARSRSDGHLLHGGSLTESERVIKMFLTREGAQRYPEYPLRHADRIIASALGKLATPMPEDLDEQHEWLLARDHGTRFLTRYLWPHASQKSKDAARQLMEAFMQVRFARYFVPAEGAFSLYPDAPTADLDGTGEALGMYGYLGILESSNQQRIWGAYTRIVENLGEQTVAVVPKDALATLGEHPGVHSVRLYAAPPDGHYLTGVEVVYYPEPPTVLDAADVLRQISHWLAITPQRMGNWVTREHLVETLKGIDTTPLATICDDPETAAAVAQGLLNRQGRLTLVGFDLLQVPRVALHYRLAD